MEIEEYLSTFSKFTENPTLEAMDYIMGRFDNPQDKIKCVHVAGTNGKGSICEMMTNVLIQSGYKVGKFISPHLIRFNDGICINNKEIDDSDVAEILAELSKVIEEYNSKSVVKVKWFEAITALVYIYFERQKVDIAVIEVGLGGTTDCTNIINPLVSIIANIGYDHMDILGDTIEEIARHKAGIIKENSDTVAVEQKKEVIDIIKEICETNNNKLHMVKEADIINYKYDDEYQTFDYKDYKNIKINLKGKVQTLNASEVLAAIEVLKKKGFEIPDEAIKAGLSTVIHRARMEQISKRPLIIFDGGHNESAINNLRENLKRYYKDYEKKIYIVSILNTKDYRTIIKNLCEDKKGMFIFTNGINKKNYVDNKILCKEARKHTDESNLAVEELEDAINIAKEEYKDNLILIVGSFYVYKKTCEILNNN